MEIWLIWSSQAARQGTTVSLFCLTVLYSPSCPNTSFMHRSERPCGHRSFGQHRLVETQLVTQADTGRRFYLSFNLRSGRGHWINLNSREKHFLRKVGYYLIRNKTFHVQMQLLKLCKITFSLFSPKVSDVLQKVLLVLSTSRGFVFRTELYGQVHTRKTNTSVHNFV